MMQAIDEDYLRRVSEMEDGFARLLRMQNELLERAETAEAIAQACIREIAPLRRQRDDLTAALNQATFDRRDLRNELQAEIDAAHAELEQWREGTRT